MHRMTLDDNIYKNAIEIFDEENYVFYTTDKDDNIICYPNGHTIGLMKIDTKKIVVPATV